MQTKNSAIGTYRRLWRANARAAARVMGDRLTLVESMFDAYAGIERHFHWVASKSEEFTHIRSPVKCAMTLCYKSSLAIFSAYELTRHGFYGSAGPLLRQSYEGLLIGKYCCLAKTRSLHDRWIGGEPVFVGRDVLRKIRDPNPEPLHHLWQDLCEISHSSIYFQQVALEFGQNAFMVGGAFVFIMMLLECTYHLLGSYVMTSTTRHYAQSYGKAQDIPALVKKLKCCFRKSREDLAPGAVRAVCCYKRKWTLVS